MQDCIFCKIINGEIPAFKIYEDEDLIAILDRFPLTTGHTLIIPKKHVKNIFEMDEITVQKIFAAAQKLSSHMQKMLNLDGLNLHQSNGEIAGQTIFHFHLHLLPRYNDDGVSFEMPKRDITIEELEKIAELIKL